MKGLALVAVSSILLLAGQFGTEGAAAAQHAGSLDYLVGLLADRIDTADTVAAVKWAVASRDGQEPVIDDPVREAAIYDAMAQLGAQRDLPESWVREVFLGQIEASKIVQRGLVTQWRSGLEAAPTPAMDLTAVRPVIDRVDAEIIAELAARRVELASPDSAARLASSVVATIGSRQGDPLHEAALVRATVPLCEAPASR
ncbi:MAG: Chorismate mutase [Nocardia sp.]|uniref:chorismate mutase n=1 Tax=Nocardia sp. TaxID=1821 RepID=UPI00260FA18E|nr:chorismate mutase [Nocardia sp.]MCU1640352.1 Chorismate mutase [Nocardia sp.]